jgi:hypothetical protein
MDCRVIYACELFDRVAMEQNTSTNPTGGQLLTEDEVIKTPHRNGQQLGRLSFRVQNFGYWLHRIPLYGY